MVDVHRNLTKTTAARARETAKIGGRRAPRFDSLQRLEEGDAAVLVVVAAWRGEVGDGRGTTRWSQRFSVDSQKREEEGRGRRQEGEEERGDARVPGRGVKRGEREQVRWASVVEDHGSAPTPGACSVSWKAKTTAEGIGSKGYGLGGLGQADSGQRERDGELRLGLEEERKRARGRGEGPDGGGPG
jgi:hypothetical protein